MLQNDSRTSSLPLYLLTGLLFVLAAPQPAQAICENFRDFEIGIQVDASSAQVVFTDVLGVGGQTIDESVLSINNYSGACDMLVDADNSTGPNLVHITANTIYHLTITVDGTIHKLTFLNCDSHNGPREDYYNLLCENTDTGNEDVGLLITSEGDLEICPKGHNACIPYDSWQGLSGQSILLLKGHVNPTYHDFGPPGPWVAVNFWPVASFSGAPSALLIQAIAFCEYKGHGYNSHTILPPSYYMFANWNGSYWGTHAGTATLVRTAKCLSLGSAGAGRVAAIEGEAFGFVTGLSNHPNPFNPTTTIAYTLKEETWVTLKVYDVLGKEIATLVDGAQGTGAKSAVWDGRDAAGTPMPSGTYFYSIVAGDLVQTKTMILLK